MRREFHGSRAPRRARSQGNKIFDHKIMGKNNTPKPAAAAKKPAAKVIAKKKATAVPPPAVVEAPVEVVASVKRTRKPAAPKTAKVPKTPRAAKLPPAPKPTTYTQADVSLRAYFIAERRHSLGIHGDPHSDWVEAERQLKEEFAVSSAPRKPKTKKA